MNLVDNELVEKWAPVLEGIDDTHTRECTAQLLENQAKSIISERIDEDMSAGSTTVGKLGTFQKFAFPLVRRVYPELIANKICGVQPMKGPVSQVFYLGHSRARDGGGANNEQVIYSQYRLTYRGLVASSIGETGALLDGDEGDFDLSSMIGSTSADGEDTSVRGNFSSTVGGQIAAWPSANSILGWSVSAGEQRTDGEIPEINFHIEQQAVVARTRKMRAIWSIEASQDLKAYHNLDLERELTDLLSKELTLEIDRELIEDIRGLAYDPSGGLWGSWDKGSLNEGESNSFGLTKTATGDFTPGNWQFDQTGMPTDDGLGRNVFAIDLTASSLPGAPRHMGDVYANLLALINLASQDIYRTTWRGPGSWLLTSPMVASFLESASKLEGGIAREDGPTNFGNTSIEYKGKFAGRYDLFVDPLYPTDEILVGYKGSGPMDAGYVYCPYIPLQQLPTITDPHTFQPRKGILTRYGKVAIEPTNRYYRVIRFIGPLSNYMWSPFAKVGTVNNSSDLAY